MKTKITNMNGKGKYEIMLLRNIWDICKN